ncbi:uncharacterized protein LOC144987426 isoform X2 [Oryzias latipes]
MDFRSGTAAAVLLLVLLCGGSEGLQNITAEPGQNVTLTCEAPKNLTVLVAEWTRTILDKECLFVVRQNHIMEDVHQQFRNRLFLPEDAKGGGSVVVRNVTFKDSGTFVCRIKQTRTRDKIIRNSLNLISIRLSVVPPGDPSPGDEDDGTRGVGNKHGSSADELTVGVCVGVGGFVLGFVFVMIYFIVKHQRNNNPPNNPAPPPQQTSEEGIPLNGVDQPKGSSVSMETGASSRL